MVMKTVSMMTVKSQVSMEALAKASTRRAALKDAGFLEPK